MTEPRGPSGRRPATHLHSLLMYSEDEQFLATAVPFARAGLSAGEPVFIATGPYNTRLLRRHLGPRADAVTFAPADWYTTPARTLLAYHDQAHREPGPSRVVGEAPWDGRSEDEAREWIRYEALLTLALASSGARHLCPYDTRALPGAILRAAQLTHPSLTGAGAGADAVMAAVRPNPAHMDPAEFSAACDAAPLPEPPPKRDEFHFDGPQQFARLREFTAQYARAAGLAAARLDSLLVCVDEAASNAVRHGGSGGMCRIWVAAGELVCEVTDPQGTLDTALAGYLPPSTGLLNGRGLWIVRQLSDAADMRTTPGGTVIRIRMRLAGSTARG
ncbi:anti-sigma factor RsbA family regulatory protein [Streptomyces sp. NBC_01465]|uniref:anti-sigma factor RsbA family regulatory protein n=1 Tax=Streptomyces sp. NBC_01465 TaxID=2903878 RepID=UPI002E369354|nr:anti-sigma factor RsbA family regulatory protein [Streptomyces sp. NBC_01465]